tara:strand:- start:83 stop:292 length:210 start_codon:yes stop_codon:yes gene_type:complete
MNKRRTNRRKRRTNRKTRKNRKQKGGSLQIFDALRRALLPGGLTYALLKTKKRRGRKSRKGGKSYKKRR